MKNELELLNEIKQQLLSKGEIFVTPGGPYKIIISADNWHEIFKTHEFNDLKK